MSGTAAAPGSKGGLLAAWGVHAFTASGAVIGLATLLAISAGELHRAVLLMLAAITIDSVDGTLARAARVSERVPQVDGRRLDDIVDYLNYVIVPAVFLVSAGCVSGWLVAAAPVLASAYGFSQVAAKTDDHFFVGFPSYWNVVAIYLWGLEIAPLLGSAIVLLLAATVFVPLKYVYPSRLPVLRRTTALGAFLAALLAALWVALPGQLGHLPLLEISLLFPVYYLLLSFRLGGLHRRGPSAR